MNSDLIPGELNQPSPQLTERTLLIHAVLAELLHLRGECCHLFGLILSEVWDYRFGGEM